MTSKKYEEELIGMEAGLNATKKLIKECGNRIVYDKAIKNKVIQEAQIDFFKMGYSFARKELAEQKTIKEILNMSDEARNDMREINRQDTLTPMKKCLVCDRERPEGLFIRPCGKETTACLICRGPQI